MMTQSQCELCSSIADLSTYEVPLPAGVDFQNTALLCNECQGQCEGTIKIDPQHWYCLRESIWTENPAVKVLAWRILNKLTSETWAQDLLEQLYLEDEVLQWAQSEASGTDSGNDVGNNAPSETTRDSNGAVLAAGDSVTLIKDLEVKGAGFTAKRGTLVKGINLTDDPALVEGRVNGTLIVLKTCFLKKAI